MGLVFGLIAAFIAGVAMVEMGFTDPDFTMASRIFSIVCGLIMILPGVMLFPQLIAGRRKKNTEEAEELKSDDEIPARHRFLKILKKTPVTEDSSVREHRISSFRNSYRDFFLAESIEENSKMQNDATQMHWNILAMQKKRLDNKGIRMEFDSRRMKYGSFPDHTEETYSDGKYLITEVTETIEAGKIFYKGGQTIGKDKCTQVSSIILLDPKTPGEGMVCCPNCGSQATRENLLDGCDFCKAKFNVEDLGERVSGFSFQPDYDLAYAKYQDVRSRFSLIVGLIVGIPIGILSLIGSVGAILDGAAQGSGIFMKICATFFSVAFVTFAAVFFALCIFYFCIFPFVQIFASTLHLARKNLDVLINAEKTDAGVEERIRQDDPLFSLQGLYSGLQSKLSTIFYGDTDNEMLAFSEGKDAENEILAAKTENCDVINVTNNWMRIASYEKEDNQRNMIVEGLVTITKENRGRISRSNSHIRLQVSRNASCLTKAVDGPSFTRCPGCGNAMSLLSGKKCEYCGKVRRMSELDWAITHFEVYNK